MDSATMLQGPSSLSSREAGHDDSSDFIVINGGNGSTYSFEDPDLDPFSSLSQPDAVAQAKELMSQRDLLQKNFLESVEKLTNLNIKCDELKEQERTKCEQAKHKIDQLQERIELFKAENDKLTIELSSFKSLPSASSVDTDTSDGGTDDTLSPTFEGVRCTSNGASLQSYIHVSSDLTDSGSADLRNELIELREEVERLKGEKAVISQRLDDADVEAEKHKQKRTTAERQCSSISTKFGEARHDWEMQTAGLKREINQLKARCSNLEEDMDRQAMEATAMQKEILAGLRKKCYDLETQNSDLQKRYQDLQVLCRDLEATKKQVASESHTKVLEIQTKNRELENANAQNTEDYERKLRVSESNEKDLQNTNSRLLQDKGHADDLVVRYRMEKKEADETIGMLQVEKQRMDEAVADLRQKIIKSTTMIRGMTELKSANDRFKMENSELQRTIESRDQRIADLSRSVGDDVPKLIEECDDWKAKLKKEQASSATLQGEVTRLQGLARKLQEDLQRKTSHAQQVDKLIVDLRQKFATSEGEVLRLTRENGELNSHNVSAGRATLPVMRPTVLRPTPEEPHAASAAGEINSCIFAGCTERGDYEFLLNHIERDHADG